MRAAFIIPVAIVLFLVYLFGNSETLSVILLFIVIIFFVYKLSRR